MARISFRKYLLWLLLIALVTIGGYWLYTTAIAGSPKEFTIATGRSGGAYYLYAQEYAQELAEIGITLDIQETAGSLETLQLLLDESVPVGFVQSGTAGDLDTEALYSLGSIFYEPVWVFYRIDGFDGDLEYLTDAVGKRIAIGELGSGTNQLARAMLSPNGVDDTTADLVQLPFPDAVAGLRSGDVDLGFFVLAPVSERLVELLLNEDLRLMNFRRASAYEARFPYLTEFVIGEGTVDLRRNIPAEPTTILATTAMLVANDTLHVDNARQLLTAAIDIHKTGGYFESDGEFPSPYNSELPVPRKIETFLDTGPTGLEKYLPVGVATLIERIFFVFVPLAVLLYPLFRTAPSAFSMAIRYRIYRWYQRVRRAETGMEEYSLSEIDQELAALRQIQGHLTDRVRVPLFYQADFYHLRLHLKLVMDRLIDRRAELLGEPRVSAAEDASLDGTHDPQ